jgi:hypothetical protein
MQRRKLTYPSLIAALEKNLSHDSCVDQTEKDFCLTKRSGALETFFPEEHACGTDKVSYVTKQDLLCAAKTKPGA